MTMTRALPTFRYVRVRYTNGGSQRSGGYTYRCAFHVVKGDVLDVPTVHDPNNKAVVLGSCAVEDNGFPTAKWASGFWVGNGKGNEQPWPKNFNVRDADGRLLTHNQTRFEPNDRPRGGCKIENRFADGGTVTGRFADGGMVHMDFSVLERRITEHSGTPAFMANCRSVLLAEGYGAGTEVQLKAAEKDVKRLKKRAKREKRQAEFDELTAELQKRLERQKVRDEYRSILADETLSDEVRDEVEMKLERLVVLHGKLNK